MPEAASDRRGPRVAWLTTPEDWRAGWGAIRRRVEAAGIEVEVLSVGGAVDAAPSLGAWAIPLRPLTFARLVARLTEGDFDLVHLLGDGVRGSGLPAARMAGQQVVVASVGERPWIEDAAATEGRFAAARALFAARASDATLLVAMGQSAATAHAMARRLDPLRWVTLEEGLGAAGLGEPVPSRRRTDGPIRVMVDGPDTLAQPTSAGWSVEGVGGLADDLALRKARYADLWVSTDASGSGRLRALAAAQAGAALLVTAETGWDWLVRCRGGAIREAAQLEGTVAALCGDREALRTMGERAAVYVARHFEPGAVTARLLAWYDDLLALRAGTSGPATLDLSALGAGAGATEGRARRDLLTGLRES